MMVPDDRLYFFVEERIRLQDRFARAGCSLILLYSHPVKALAFLSSMEILETLSE